MFGIEMGKATRRLRTWALVAMFVAIPTLIVLALLMSPDRPEPGEGPPFLTLVEVNGIFAGLVGLTTVQPFFLPLATGLLAGDSVAGESSSGTLRYLLVRPVPRLRLLAAKYASIVVQVFSAAVIVALTGLFLGGIAYGIGPLPSLSGATLSPAEALARLGLSVLYVTAGMAGLAAIGLFASILTDSGPGATAATVGLYIVMQIVDALTALRAVHPYLLSHYSLGFADLFRIPVSLDLVVRGLLTDGAYVVLFLGAAAAVFARKDVTT
jgi:ABC-2 type transport system permease protein